MKKFIFFSWLSFGLIINGFSQSLDQNVISSAGGIARTDNISFEWTLGEYAVETISTGQKLYTQGFHQPSLKIKSVISPPLISTTEGVLSGYNIFIAPNPVQSFFNVYIQSKKDEKFSFTLFDLSGKKLLSKELNGFDFFMRIEMGHLVSGMYFLNVRNHDGIPIKTFKIVKGN